MKVTKATLGLLLSGILITSCGDRNTVGPTGAGGSTGSYSLLPPGVYLDSAKLLLHVSEAHGQTVVLHPQQSAWDEHTATWDDVGPALSPFVLSTFHPQDTGWIRVEVTGVVKLWLDSTWPNFGLVLDQNSPEYLRSEFNSRETRALGPRLNLYCSIADSCPVYGFSASADAFVDAANPAANYGTDSLLETGWTDSDPGERRTLIAFDFQAPQEKPISRLGDRVWLDSDRDGVQDSDEAGFAGLPVKLLDCSERLLAETTTDASGHYLFDSLAAGSYQVQFGRPDGFAFTAPDAADSDLLDSDAGVATGRTGCVTLAEGSDNFSLDAGLTPVIVETRPHAMVGDKVWLDSNRNGVQDPGEPGLASVAVTLWGCPEQRLADCVTDAEGRYHFDSLEAGSYALQFAAPEGYEFTASDVAGSDLEDSDPDPVSGRTICFNLPEGAQDGSWDAGLVAHLVVPDPLAAVGNRVWNDTDADGHQDDGEPGKGGVEVALLNCDLMLIRSTHTAENGAFGFDSLVPGSYRLRFVAPDGYHFSPQIGGDAAANSDADPQSGLTECFELSGNEVDSTRDAGLFVPAPEPTASLGDRVWLDADFDGVQDEGETGVAHVDVSLFNCDGLVLAHTQTDPNGHYRFESLAAGHYQVKFSAPDGHVFSPSNPSGSDETNSDAHPESGLTGCIELSSGEVNLRVDAGVFEPGGDSSGCTRTRSFWSEHAGSHGKPDWITPHLPILLGLEGGAKSVLVDNACVARRVLGLCGRDSRNGIAALSAELLAARLNIAQGASSDAISQTLGDVDAFLADHCQESWCKLGDATRCRVKHWKDTLYSYNHGLLGPAACVD